MFFSGLGNRPPKKQNSALRALSPNRTPQEPRLPKKRAGRWWCVVAAAVVFPLVVSKPPFWQAAGTLARRARRDVGVAVGCDRSLGRFS